MSAKQATPAVDVVLGALSVAVGLVSLCGGGIRVLRPEAGVAPELFDAAFQSRGFYLVFYFSVALWIGLAALLVVAGAAMLTGARLARTLNLVYAWASAGAAVLVLLLYAIEVVPALSDASLEVADFVRLAFAAPATGCCPTFWALILLIRLYAR